MEIRNRAHLSPFACLVFLAGASARGYGYREVGVSPELPPGGVMDARTRSHRREHQPGTGQPPLPPMADSPSHGYLPGVYPAEWSQVSALQVSRGPVARPLMQSQQMPYPWMGLQISSGTRCNREIWNSVYAWSNASPVCAQDDPGASEGAEEQPDEDIHTPRRGICRRK